MKKFTFTMRGILNARTAQKEAREQELLNAKTLAMREQAKLKALENQFRQALTVSAGDAVCCSFFLQREKHVAFLKRQIQAQRVRTSAAETEVMACLGRLREADIELKKMEKIKEREHAAWQLEYQRHEQKINDEIGTSRAYFQMQHN